MSYVNRLLAEQLQHVLERGKSVLLLGPRQKGKSTLIKAQCQPDRIYNLAKTDERMRYEQAPYLLHDEVIAMREQLGKLPLITIDEVQKVPALMDEVQYLVDEQLAQFILSGSSARKLKRNEQINLLPGRVVQLRLDGLTLMERQTPLPSIDDVLLYGSLPGICSVDNDDDREADLETYVSVYLEEEIRQEGLVLNLAAFSRVLELVAVGAGNPINVSKLSQDVGILRHLFAEYLDIMSDCLVVERVPPITSTESRRRLSMSAKYLFFDCGVRRISAREGRKLSVGSKALLFEQFVGIELIRELRLSYPRARLRYWRDHAGPEVDYVIEFERKFLPIEVKWTEKSDSDDARHIKLFQQEYPCFPKGFVICRTPQPLMLADNILALSWRDLPRVIEALRTN